MKIMDFLTPKAVSADLQATDKKSVISELLSILISSKQVNPAKKDELMKVVMDREALGSTGIGQGVAIPHGKAPSVKKLVASFGISRKGIKFDSLDGEPAHIFFLLLAPQDSAGPHLKALARISRLLKEKSFRNLLCKAADEKQLFKTLKDADQAA